MVQENPFNADLASMMSTWMKMAGDSFGQSSQAWPNPFSGKTGESGAEKKPSRSQDSLDALLKTWRMVSSTMGSPENLQANLAGVSELPAIMMQLARISVDGVTRLQERTMNKVNRSSGSSGAFNPDSLDERFFEEWKTLYETEIRKYFNIPQLGLMRFHQEKLNQTADKYQVLQTAMAEFMFMLSKPFESSFKTLQDRLLEQSEKNEWPGDTKELYNKWIPILESEFAHLMRTPEYLSALERLLAAQSAFKSVKDEVIQDMTSSLPFVGRSEMDELYKELYQLRKRVKELEKSDRKATTS
jgi:poly[(R)-3-hydroxyalkanoate] polymerase subunit PhaE